MKKTCMLLALVLLAMPGSPVAAEPVDHAFRPLPYAYDALEAFVDAKTMEIHYDRHHRAYYNNMLNLIRDTEWATWTLEQMFDRIAELPVALRNNAGGHYNHELFWDMMSPDGGGEPSGALAAAIDEHVGSFEAFKAEFARAGATRFGSGWAWLSVTPDGGLVVSSTPNQDNPLMADVSPRGIPILGLDVWEHAYYLRYQNQRGSYIDAFWSVVNWPEVERRYAEASH